MSAADDVLAHALGRPATLGDRRLICIDGPSGSGKSTLARELAALTPAETVHLDDVCPGWDGLPRLAEALAAMIEDLAAGRPGHYRRYDWIIGALAEERVVAPGPLLILEGVGAGHRAWAALTTTLVWTEAPVRVRQQRAFARDGDSFRAHWDAWAAAEDALFALERPRDRADLLLET